MIRKWMPCTNLSVPGSAYLVGEENGVVVGGARCSAKGADASRVRASKMVYFARSARQWLWHLLLDRCLVLRNLLASGVLY